VVCPKLFALLRLRMSPQFLRTSLCDLYFETVRLAQLRQQLHCAEMHKLWCRGDGGGVPSLSVNETARIRCGFGPFGSADYECGTNPLNFVQTIWGRGRYERLLDFGNGEHRDCRDFGIKGLKSTSFGSGRRDLLLCYPTHARKAAHEWGTRRVGPGLSRRSCCGDHD
jgi:hypothetical protein